MGNRSLGPIVLLVKVDNLNNIRQFL
jgi:hypothetical protein